jgi:6-phosphofructokinase 2
MATSFACLSVTLNPTIDIGTTVARLVNHEKLRCDTPIEHIGGGGLNVARVMQSLGTPCQAFWLKSRRRGQEIAQALEREGIKSLTIPIKEDNRLCLSVYESSTDQEYRFILPGPQISADEQTEAFDAILNHLPQHLLIISGSLPPGVDTDFYARIIRATRQMAPHVRVVLDCSGACLLNALQAGVFLVKPSRDELTEVHGHPLASQDDYLQACQRLIKNGYADIVALTLGKDGALLVTDKQAWQVAPLAIEVKSTVGAGDSFLAGMAHALMSGHSMVRAAQTATAAAAAALQTRGHLDLQSTDVAALAKQVQISPLAVL